MLLSLRPAKAERYKSNSGISRDQQESEPMAKKKAAKAKKVVKAKGKKY